MNEQRSRTEEFTLNGDEVVAKVRELINEGNIRRLILRNEDGKTLMEIPLSVGLVGGVAVVALAPILAAVGALAALVTRLSIVVERAAPEEDTTVHRSGHEGAATGAGSAPEETD